MHRETESSDWSLQHVKYLISRKIDSKVAVAVRT